MTDTQKLRDRIHLIEAELHEHQRKQQALIAALERARAELVALDGGVTIYDGEPIG